MLTLVGVGAFLFFFGGMQWAKSRHWRRLARKYAGSADRAIKTRRMQNVVLIGLGGYTSLKGIVTVGVHARGVSFRPFTALAMFHEPLFIPFDEIRGWQTTWYLDARSTELEFRRVPDMKMVVPQELAEWMQDFAGERMTLRQSPPPKGRAGRGWHVVLLVHFGIVTGLMAWLSVNYLSK